MIFFSISPLTINFLKNFELMGKKNILVFYKNRNIWKLFFKIFFIFMFLSLSIYMDVIIFYLKEMRIYGVLKSNHGKG